MAWCILPDTDVLLDFFRGYRKAVTMFNDNIDRIVLSSIVVAGAFACLPGAGGRPAQYEVP